MGKAKLLYVLTNFSFTIVPISSQNTVGKRIPSLRVTDCVHNSLFPDQSEFLLPVLV